MDWEEEETARTLTPAATARQAHTQDETRRRRKEERGKKQDEGRRKQTPSKKSKTKETTDWTNETVDTTKEGKKGMELRAFIGLVLRTGTATKRRHDEHGTRNERRMHQHIHINRSINQEGLGDLKLGKSSHLEEEINTTKPAAGGKSRNNQSNKSN
jgi:hypothetical protein